MSITSRQSPRQGDDDIQKLLSVISHTSSQSPEAISAIKSLADASKDATTRETLGQYESLSIILTFLESLITQSSVGSLTEPITACLRCIGNACIDNDEARRHVINSNISLTWINNCLDRASDSNIRRLTAKVLYNLCMDNEDCQKACFENMLHVPVQQVVIDELNCEHYEDLPLLLELLFWIVSQKPVESVQSHITDAQLISFICMPPALQTHVSTEDFASAVESCLCLLRDAKLQQIAVDANMFGAIWILMKQIELRILARSEDKPSESIMQIDQIDRADDENNGEEDVKLLVPLSTSLTWIMSDMSALPGFAPASSDLEDLSTAIYKLGEVNDPLEKPSHERMASAACQVYGNYLFSRPLSTDHSVEDLHKTLFKEIVQTENAELMYSAAGLVIHLSRPSVEAREVIASDVNATSAMEKLCRHSMTQLKQAGTKLLRALGKDSERNQTVFATLAQEVMIDLQNSANADGTSNAPQMINGLS